MKKETKKPITNLQKYSKTDKFLYMLLSRLQMDCLYFLGCGARNEKHLWALNVKDHLNEMKCIYNYLAIKPEWITPEDLAKYERDMQ